MHSNEPAAPLHIRILGEFPSRETVLHCGMLPLIAFTLYVTSSALQDGNVVAYLCTGFGAIRLSYFYLKVTP